MRKLISCATLLVLALAGWLLPCSSSRAEISGGIVSQPQARQLGLTRAWFTQIELDRSRSRVVYVTQFGDGLFAQTDAGILHALDANTGKTLWTTQVGKPSYPSLAPAASDKYVAVVNGSTLYLIDRATGHNVWSHSLGGGPGAGPAITKDHVYVPLINGNLEAYNLKDPKLPPWIFASAGRAMVQPIATGRSVAWPTDRGHLYVAQTEGELAIRFRVETNDAITSPAAYHKPYLFVSSLDGNVYAVNEMTGEQAWRFTAGDPIAEPPSVIDDHVFVPTDHGGMYCLDAKTGRELWWSQRMERFLAASKERVYATDNLFQLYILDLKTGARLAALPIYGMNMLMVNQTTDRIYLASDTGLIQCLHDTSLEQPIYHNVDPASPGAVEAAPVAKKPAAAPAEGDAAPAEPGADPFGAEKPGADPFGGDKPAADPFGGDKPAAPAEGGDEKPAEEKPADEKPADDPFGKAEAAPEKKPAAEEKDPFG